MKTKKLIALMCCAALTTGMFAGCGSSEEKKADASEGAKKEVTDDLSEHVTITLGIMGGTDSDSVEGYPTEVVEDVQDKFNITLEMKAYDDESLNLDLSGGTTTDIVLVGDDNIEGVVKGKHAVNLEQYKDTLAKNIFREDMEFRNSMMKKFKSNGEDTQYFVTPRVSFKDTQANYGTVLNNGYVVRWDLYKEIGCPEINNDEDYIEALKAMKEIYPETEDGLPVYAMSAYNDSQLHAYFYNGCLSQGFINLNNGIYVQSVENNELYPDIYDVDNPDVLTPFWSGVQFYNQLYREGLLDPDCFITKSEDLQEKYNKGQYLGGNVNWYYGTYNENQRAEDPETLKEYVTLPAKLGWANEKNLAGWFGKYYFVSSHSPNVERAVMVLDYLQSQEFSRKVDSGVEGRWEKGKDGKPALTEDTISMKTDGSRLDEWKKAGIGGSLSNECGEDYYNIAEDGGRISLWFEEDVLPLSMTYAEKDMCETLGLDVPSDMLKKKVEAGTSMDLGNCLNAIQMALETTPKNIVRIDSNCEEITMNAIPNLVQAETDEEFVAAKAALMEELKGAGVEESVEWWTNAWKAAKAEVEKLLQ